MPKKLKKNGEKQSEDKNTQIIKNDLDSATKSVSEDKEKSLYLAQIRFMNEKLERFELKCDELEKQSKHTNLKYSALEKEKEDIVDFLRRSLLEKEEELVDLCERLESVQQAAQEEQEEMQQKHSLQKDQLQNRTEALTAENGALMEKLAHVEQFLKERDQLMTNLEALKKQLSHQEEEHKAVLHNQDMNTLLEKKRWEKELESHVACMEAKVQCLVNQKLPETTSLTIQENKELKTRFSQLSEHAQGLVEKNTALQKQKTQLSLDVENLEQMLSEVSRKNCIQKKVMEQLTEKCAQLQTELSQCRKQHQQLHSQHSQSLDEMKTLRQDKISVSKQCNKNQAVVSRLEAQLQEERQRRKEMKSIIEETSIILKQALTEADVEDSKQPVGRWRLLMQKLLVVLDKPPRSKATVREEKLNPILSLKFSSYRPQELGPVPEPTLKHKHQSHRSAAACPHTGCPPVARQPAP